MSNGPYYKTVIRVEVLSKGEPFTEFDDLEAVHAAITDGPCSGTWSVEDPEQLTGPEMAEALMAQGSDPEFFGLEEDGTEIDAHNDE